MTRRPNSVTFAVGLAALAALDQAAAALGRLAARQPDAWPTGLPYPGFDESGVIAPFDETEALLMAWTDGLPEELGDWLANADGEAS